MYTYPLRFQVGSWTTNDHMQVQDAKKQPILFGAPPHDNQPYTLCVSKKDPRPLCQIRKIDEEEHSRWEITSPDETKLGTVVKDKDNHWTILDSTGIEAGYITLKNGWRNGTLDFFSVHPTLFDSLLILIMPFVYTVEWHGHEVLRLREKDWEVWSHKFQLKNLGDLNETEELLLLASLVALFWGE